MPKDPICGMSVSDKTKFRAGYQGETYLFCSFNCLEKFCKEHQIPLDYSFKKSAKDKRPFYKNKSIIVLSILTGLVILSYLFSFLVPFRNSLFIYVKTIWWAVILGFVLGGLIEQYIPRQYISYVLAQPKKRTIFYSVFLGFLMSACSHGILALSIQLHKKGASGPAVVAFLLASPWANMTITIMLIGFFGLKAFFIIGSAIIIAIITGLIFQVLERKGLIERNNNAVDIEKDFSIKEDVKRKLKKYKFSIETIKSDIKGVYKGAVSLADMVLWWVLIGVGIASIAGAYIPTEVFQSYMGPTFLGLLVTLILATIIEVCSEGSAPMAFEIFRQTRALGNSFVFLMAGVVTDYTEIGLIWHNIGRKTAIWLPIISVPQVIIMGLIANAIF